MPVTAPTLLRTPGAPVAGEPSSADPARGTRTRAGNAMGRTRTAVLDGASRVLAGHGARRTTMVDLAEAAGIAKGTLYNHMRTRAEVYQALAEREVDTLVSLLAPSAAEPGPARALAAAGSFVAAHPVVRGFAVVEPASLAALAVPGPDADPLHDRLRDALATLLGADRAGAAYRWLVGLLSRPAGDAEIAAEAASIAGRPAVSIGATHGWPASAVDPT